VPLAVIYEPKTDSRDKNQRDIHTIAVAGYVDVNTPTPTVIFERLERDSRAAMSIS
jgi:hypothetical protein